jgi:hypothetical protein
MQTAPTQPAPLSNLQLELLKLYSFGISAEEILEVKRLLGQHFADRLSAQASAAYREQGWTTATLDAWLNDEHQ